MPPGKTAGSAGKKIISSKEAHCVNWSAVQQKKEEIKSVLLSYLFPLTRCSKKPLRSVYEQLQLKMKKMAR